MPSNVSVDITPERYASAEDGAVFGRVEVLNDTVVTGWIFIKGASAAPELSLEIGGEPLGVCHHFIPRADVAAVAGGAAAFGFRFDVPTKEWHSYALLHSSAKVTTATGIEVQKAFANTDIPNVGGRTDLSRFRFAPGDTPLVSVIIPVYDRVQLLRESIRSVLEQTYTNIELLLIGDDPPPNTLLVMREFETDPRLKSFIYHKRSGNACRGRNTGILLAKGDIIALQDSDDLAFPNRIADTVYAFTNARHGELDLVYTSIRALTDGTRTVDEIGFGQRVDARFLPMREMELINPMFTCTVSIRRDTLLLHGAFRSEMTYREDHELWLRLAHRGCSFGIVPIPSSLYRIHAGNAELTFLRRDEEWKSLMLERYKQPFSG